MYLKDEGVKHGDCLMACVQWRRDGDLLYGIVSRSGTQAAGRRNDWKERAGGGDKWGSGAPKAPLQRHRCDIIQQMRHESSDDDGDVGGRREWELKCRKPESC